MKKYIPLLLLALHASGQYPEFLDPELNAMIKKVLAKIPPSKPLYTPATNEELQDLAHIKVWENPDPMEVIFKTFVAESRKHIRSGNALIAMRNLDSAHQKSPKDPLIKTLSDEVTDPDVLVQFKTHQQAYIKIITLLLDPKSPTGAIEDHIRLFKMAATGEADASELSDHIKQTYTRTMTPKAANAGSQTPRPRQKPALHRRSTVNWNIIPG